MKTPGRAAACLELARFSLNLIELAFCLLSDRIKKPVRTTKVKGECYNFCKQDPRLIALAVLLICEAVLGNFLPVLEVLCVDLELDALLVGSRVLLAVD